MSLCDRGALQGLFQTTPLVFGSGIAVVQDHALEAEADRFGRIAANSGL